MKQIFLISCAVLAFGSVGAAAEHDHSSAAMTHPEMTKDQRAQMATVHEQMAACLRSDKTMSACHDEMKTACSAKNGENGCPMMMDGMMGNGMMGKNHMKDSKQKAPKPAK